MTIPWHEVLLAGYAFGMTGSMLIHKLMAMSLRKRMAASDACAKAWLQTCLDHISQPPHFDERTAQRWLGQRLWLLDELPETIKLFNAKEILK